MSLISEAITAALKDFNEVKKALKRAARAANKGSEEYESKFRTRALHAPTLIGTSGLLPTLTFYYAKSGLREYQDTLKILRGGETEVGPDEFAYGAYLYLVIKRLVELAPLEGVSPDDPLSCFRRLAEATPFELSALLTRLIPYLLEIMKLSEAEFEAER